MSALYTDAILSTEYLYILTYTRTAHMYTGLYNFGVQGGARATCDSISCDACMTS
jgi:hypothetical protein